VRSDRQLLRRAALSVAVQTALAVALVVAVVAVLVFVFNQREQSERARQAVRSAALTADDVGDPPAGVILVEYRGGGAVAHSAGAPSGTDNLTLSDVDSGLRTVHIGSASYQAYVADQHDGRRFVALTSMTARDDDQRRLLDALLLAGVVGVVGSAVVGGLIGWLAARPMGRALALQRRFVADASHELRTPLTVLHTRAQLLDRRAAQSGDAALAAQTGDLVADTRAMGAVVEDLLLSAQLEHQPERAETVDLAVVVAGVVRTFSDHAATLEVSLVADLPDDAPFLVDGVESALRRAVSALVDNALGHEHAGGRITIGLRRQRRVVELFVADDGSGLDPRGAEELMRRFVRGPARSGHSPRFGIGLALVREVVQAHRGTIRIDGEPGIGARFTLTFPPHSLESRET
jgi:signal transduction histidine kinase